MQNSKTSTAHSQNAHAAILRNTPGSLGHSLEESASLTVIAEYNKQCRFIEECDTSNERLKIAEDLLDTVIESQQTKDYELVMQHVEEKYRERWFNERDFRLGLLRLEEDLGNYVTRTYFGSVKALAPHEHLREFPNCTRHIWRGQFDKAHIVIAMNVYEKNGVHFISDLMLSYQ